MKTKFSSALSIVLLGVLVFSLVGDVSTARAASVCNAAQFVADVTIPDGTYINPGNSFTKTWRLKNVGTCSWSTSYGLVFVSGERMGGLSPIFLTRYVSPGQAIDLTVQLTAPTSGGTFRGYWKLQNGSGTQFGIGGGFSNPFWVEIRVLGDTSSVVAYDFVANMCAAQWGYDGGPIPCPVNNSKKDFGYVLTLNNPLLENGQAAGSPALLTIPQNKFNGAIHGAFPVDAIFRGDHFQAIIGCQYGAVNCAVTYQLDYISAGGEVTLWRFKEQYDGLYYQVDLDLSPIANRKDVQLVLSVYASGPNVGDQALWVAPRIVRNVETPGPTPIPPTPTPPIFVPTNTPFPTPVFTCTDRAQFVTDVTVPDGTVFAPNASFNKVWRLKNVGTCTWNTAYSLTFVSGDSMGATNAALPQTVAPGQTVDAGVNLTAPSFAGSYRGFWELKNASGTVFGIGSTFDKSFWVAINVSGTALPSPTPTQAVTTSTPQSPTATSTPPPPTATATSTTINGWNTYQNVKYAFSFQFPPGSTLASQSDNTGRIYLPITAGTNLLQKYLDISVVEGLTTCKSPNSNPQVPSQNVTFNGIQFLRENWLEGATSHQGDWTAYSTAKGNACVILSFLLWSVEPSVMETPPPVFDRAAESAVFDTIMSTFAWQQ